MALVPDQIRDRFPEFTLDSDGRINMAILESIIIMGDSVERWGGQDMYYMANSYLVAHLITAANATAAGDENAMSPLRRTSVDDVEVDYAVSMGIPFLDSDLASTAYGKRYLFYRGLMFTGGVVT